MAMSDPVTNGEMEDVLSSIRRLVSEDSRSRPEARSGTRPERLVLTPALRVKEDDESHGKADATVPLRLDHLRSGAEDESVAQPCGGPEPSEPGTDGGAVSLATEAPDANGDAGAAPPDGIAPERAAGALGAARACTREARAEAPPVSVPEGSAAGLPSDRPPPATPATVLSRLVNQEIARALRDAPGSGARDDASEAQADTPDPPVMAQSTEFIDAAPAGRDVAETTSAAESADLEERAPCQDGGGMDADAKNLAQSEDMLQPETDALPSPPAVVAERMAEHVPEDVPEASPEDATRADLASKIAALEDMVGRDAGEWKDDATDMAGAFVHRPAGVSGLEAAQPAQEPAGQDGSWPAKGDWYADEPVTLDEDVLRDMVAEIVRKELQGALGERITRNVRKLVRREIHRIVMSREFD